jgi:undecaprenyl-diphosphatase
MNFGSLDTALFLALNTLAGHSAVGDAAIVVCASYLPYLLVVAFLVSVCRMSLSWAQRTRRIFFAFIAVVLAQGVSQLIQLFIFRPRPFITHSVHQLIQLHSLSFPSGHALTFFAFSTVVYAYNRKLGIASFIATALICIARVAAGIHYPSDIIVGAVIGILCGLLVNRYSVRVAPDHLSRF